MTEISSNLRSSISALMKEYHTITHNIANAGTAGFKRRASSFSAVMDEQKKVSGGKNTGKSLEIKTNIDFSQGHLEQTSKRLDAAISGEGFFVIQTPQGSSYTRNGQFNLNQQGQIVDVEGRIVSGDAGAIVIPANIGESQINIDVNGTVSAAGTDFGKIQMVEFGNDIARLKPVGGNCFVAPQDVTPVPADNSFVKQGFCESSNVNTVNETVNLITVSRMYEASMNMMMKKSESSKIILNVAMG